jgi:hypothetical protein
MLISPKTAAVLASLAFLASSAATAQSKVELDKLQVIKDWGYSISPIKGWNAIPVRPEEKNVVGHWQMSLDEARKRGDYESWHANQHCELVIVRISTQVATPDPAKPKEGEDKKTKNPGIKLPPSLEKKLNPKTIEEYIDANYDGADKRWVRKPLKGSKTPGEYIEFGADAEAVAIGVFKKDNVEWAVIYKAFEENYKKTWQDMYLRSIQTFVLSDLSSTGVAAAAHKDISKLKGDEKRDALKATIAGNPGWYSIDSSNYVFLSNSKNRQFVESLVKELEVVREKVYIPMFPPRNQEESISPVRILDTQSEYHQYGGPGGSAGYFNSGSGELVLFTKFEDVTKTNSLAYCKSVMFHEGFHQYIHYAVGDVSPHSWFNEGHGDYFAGLSAAGGSIKVSPFNWRVKELKEKKNSDLIPLRTLIRMEQREYYNNAGLKYAEGWALIYYLRSVSKTKAHVAILDNYFTYLADNVEAFRAKKKKDNEGGDESGGEVPGIPGVHIVNFEDAEKVHKILSEAVDHAFAGVDMDALEKEFFAWVKKL